MVTKTITVGHCKKFFCGSEPSAKFVREWRDLTPADRDEIKHLLSQYCEEKNIDPDTIYRS